MTAVFSLEWRTTAHKIWVVGSVFPDARGGLLRPVSSAPMPAKDK